MRKIRNQVAVVVLLLGMGLAAAAQTAAPRVYREGKSWVEESTGTLPAARILRVETQVGSVRVEGGAQGISYTVRKRVFVESESAARREFENFRVSGRSSPEAAVIYGEFTGGGPRRFSADFQIDTPRELELARIVTRGGSVGVENIAGRVEAETAGGSMNLENIGGVVRAQTMGGSVEVSNTGSDVAIKTAGGGINAENVGGNLYATTYGGSISVGVAKQSAVLESMGGSIQVRQTGGDLKATTAGGNLDAGNVGGTAILKTAGGSIRLASARGVVHAATAGGGITLSRLEKGARAETAAGGITAYFVNGRQISESLLETTAGDITVYLPQDAACTVRAAIEMASGHKIRSDFPELKITSEGGDFGPREVNAWGPIGGGGPTLRLRTSIGDIEIRRASSK